MADGRFGCEADMAGPAAGSTRSLVTHQRHRPRGYDALHFDFKLIVQARRMSHPLRRAGHRDSLACPERLRFRRPLSLPKSGT